MLTIKLDIQQKALTIGDRQFKDTISNLKKLVSKDIIYKGPITRYYDFPSKYPKPMAHQVITADYVCRHRRGYVFNSIGTGKTLIMDWVFDFLQKEKEVKKGLIVSPLSTLECVHADELRFSLPHLSFAIVHGSRQKKIKQLKQDVDVYIINFDGLKSMEHELNKRDDIDCIFIDELSILRNTNNHLWNAANRLYGYHTNKMMWGFTGSPMPKEPTDCYGQACLIRPDKLPLRTNWHTKTREPISYTRFKKMTMVQLSEFTWVPKSDWEKICYGILQPSIRFETKDCTDLPPLVTEFRDIEMSGEQSKAYSQMRKHMIAEIGDYRVTAVSAAIKIMKLVQITSGGIYHTEKNETILLDCKKRFQELYNIADGTKGHVLIFAPFKNILTIIQEKLQARYGQGCAEIVSSAVSAPKRADIYRSFTQGSLRFIVAIPSCMSHGLNLQPKCHTGIWWGPIDRYDVYEQACGRIYRTGQNSKTLVVHFQSSGAEKKLYSKLKTKESNQQLLLNLLKG